MRKAVVWLIVLGTAAAMSEPAEGGAGLEELFGNARTDRLLRSADPEDRLHGLERAAAAHTPEALALLLRFRDDLGGNGGDPRTLLTLVRGFADSVDVPAVRAKLVGIARDPGTFLSLHGKIVDEDPVDDERIRVARIELARAEADMALARSREPDAIKSLFEIVRDSDTGREAATEALAAFPPDVLTSPSDSPSIATVGVLSSLGDLRSEGNVLSAARSSDAAVRAASLVALAGFGDPHALDTARAWRRDPDARVRLAAAATLVRSGDPDAAHAVEDLIGDDETAEDGLLLAQHVQGEGVAKATIARAVASASPILRRAAVAALSRQTTGSAAEVLLTLTGDPLLAGPAADGLARSSSEFALSAIEELGARTASRRLAARAYFVRRYIRGDRSSRLEALLDRLGSSSDGADRAVALEARVGLGEKSVQAAWTDGDARVRRAAALGALGRLDSNTATVLLRRLTTETDETTRVILAGALTAGDTGVAPSNAKLRGRLAAGAPDASLAAFVLGRRDDGTSGNGSDALYTSRDPFVRAAALRGLGASKAPDASARLASAYRWECAALVRRAIIEALATRTQDRESEFRRQTLDLASRLDPDAGARGAARRALSDRELPRPAVVPDVAWIVLAPADAAALPANVTGLLVGSGGLGFPIAFDDDGFALLPGIQAGEAQLRLAARLPAYSPGGP